MLHVRVGHLAVQGDNFTTHMGAYAAVATTARSSVGTDARTDSQRSDMRRICHNIPFCLVRSIVLNLLCGYSVQLGVFLGIRFRFALVTFSPAPFVRFDLPANRSVLAMKLVNAEDEYALVP